MQKAEEYAIIQDSDKKREVVYMDKSLKGLNIEEIIQEIGLYMPILDTITCFKNDKTAEEFYEIADKMGTREIIQYMKNHEKEFDVKKFIFLNYLYISGEKKIPATVKAYQVPERDRKLRQMSEYLAQNPTVLVDTNYDTFIEKAYDTREYTNISQRKKHQDEIKNSLDRLNKMKDMPEFDYFLLVQILNDIERFYCKNPEIGNMMRQNIIIKTHSKDEGITREKLIRYIENGAYEEDKSFYEFLPAFREELTENAEYIDWDKFLLVSAFRAKDTLERAKHSDMDEMNHKALVLIMQKAYELITDKRARISGEMELIGGEEKGIRYTYADLEKDIEEKIIDGKYYGKSELAEIRRKIEAGKITIGEVYSKKILNLLHIKENEKATYIELNQQNAVDLYRNGLITREKLKLCLGKLEIKDEIITQLMDKEMSPEKIPAFTTREIFELYQLENISLDSLVKIEGIDEITTERKLIEQYKSLKNATPEEKMKIERFFSAFRELKIKGKTPEEKNEIGNNIIFELGEDMEEQDFINLYERNIIPLETIKEWNGEQFIREMFSKGTLKPTDSKQEIKDGIIGIEQIKIDLLKKGLTDEEKMTLIMSTFDGEDEQDIREELFQLLAIEDEKSIESTPVSREKRKNKREISEPGVDKKEYIMDPCYKMQLLRILDKDYSSRMTRDGHLVLKLPNINKVIVEKMFKRDRAGKVIIANNAASYIIDTDLFEGSGIITDEQKINRTALYQLAKDDKAKRIYHTQNWGRVVTETVEQETLKRYPSRQVFTAEDKKKQDEIIERIQRTRTLKDF